MHHMRHELGAVQGQDYALPFVFVSPLQRAAKAPRRPRGSPPARAAAHAPVLRKKYKILKIWKGHHD